MGKKTTLTCATNTSSMSSQQKGFREPATGPQSCVFMLLLQQSTKANFNHRKKLIGQIGAFREKCVLKSESRFSPGQCVSSALVNSPRQRESHRGVLELIKLRTLLSAGSGFVHTRELRLNSPVCQRPPRACCMEPPLHSPPRIPINARRTERLTKRQQAKRFAIKIWFQSEFC
jgi:hypothetical protein